MADSKNNTESRQTRSGYHRATIFLTLLILLLVIVGFFGSKTRVGQNLLSVNSQSKPAAVQADKPQQELGPMVNLSEFLVNIISEDNSNYLKTSMTIELSNTDAQHELDKRMPQVRDAILMLLSNKTYDELYDLHGKKQLKAEITLTVNALLSSGDVTAVYLTDFIVQ